MSDVIDFNLYNQDKQMEFEFMSQDSIDYLGDYQEFVESMIITKGTDRLAENTLGLVGEAGEVAEKIKKIFRDKNSMYSITDIEKELGDVVFYVTALANYFDLDLVDILETNVNKLKSRKDRGVIQGSGDER